MPLTKIIKAYQNYLDIVFSSEKLNFYINICLLFLISVLLISHLSDIDIFIQKLFYSNQDGWLIDKNNLKLKFIFYYLPKKIITIILLLILILNIYLGSNKNYKNHILKKIAFFVLIGISGSILLISFLKQITNMHCPDSVEIFGGTKPYIKLFEIFPKDFKLIKNGKCYPAGHASAGFSLLTIGFVIANKKHRFNFFITLHIIGWIMGIYQIAKGSHYLSDTIVTNLICLLFPLVIYKFFFIFNNKKSKDKTLL